jgi:hypothetical protein
MGKTFRICPKCKTPSLKPAYNVSGWLAPDMFRCQNCRYVGNFYIEVDEEEYSKYQEEEAKQKDNQ